MSDTVMGIWSSLVRLAGAGTGSNPLATTTPAIHTQPRLSAFVSHKSVAGKAKAEVRGQLICA